jgi:hypothetical protein
VADVTELPAQLPNMGQTAGAGAGAGAGASAGLPLFGIVSILNVLDRCDDPGDDTCCMRVLSIIIFHCHGI